MNATQVACNNTFHPTETIPQIVAFRISRTCLETCDGEPQTFTPPLFDDFPQTLFDTEKWTGVDGAAISFNGIGEPSEPFTANINGSDQLRSAILDAEGASLVTLSYWWQRTGNGDSPEPTEDLFVEYRLDDDATWVVANQHLGDGPDMTTFEFVSLELPADAFHDGLRVRFRGTAALDGLDDYFVDDVLIDVLLAPSNNSCASGILINEGLTPFTTLGASTDGPDESGGGCGAIESDVWYKYINPCEGTVTIGVCDADFDTQIAVYQVCPGAPDQFIACNDDFCGQQSQLTFSGVATLYRLRVGGAGGATGSGTLDITCTPGVACPGDCGVVDGAVDIQDLLALLAQWGGAGTCDITPAGGDGNVDIQDLLDLLAAWGDCD
jgi:hypothetical protein